MSFHGSRIGAMIFDEVEVRPIPGYEGRYWIAADGEVVSRRTGDWATLAVHAGIRMIGVQCERCKRQHIHPAHLALALAWLPPPTRFPVRSKHINRDKPLHPSNVRWEDADPWARRAVFAPILECPKIKALRPLEKVSL